MKTVSAGIGVIQRGSTFVPHAVWVLFSNIWIRFSYTHETHVVIVHKKKFVSESRRKIYDVIFTSLLLRDTWLFYTVFDPSVTLDSARVERLPPTASFLSAKIFCVKRPRQRTESIITPVFVVINYDCGVCLRVPSRSRGILQTLAAPKSSVLLSFCSNRTNLTTIFFCFALELKLKISKIFLYRYIYIYIFFNLI